MAFLPGWKRFVDITIPDTLIDEDITQPAILVKISASSGIGSKDASFILSELGDEGKLKIAFTEAGLVDQKYAEIEYWSSGDEEAYVWVSKSDLVLDADGNPAYVLRMYFDADHADNTDYIGVPGSAPGEAVWDSYYKMVQHMTGAAYTDLDDSTSNDNDVSGEGGDPTYNAAGQVGNAVSFDGAGDKLSIGDAASLDITGDLTIEMGVKIDASMDDSLGMLLVKRDDSNYTSPYQVSFDDRDAVSRMMQIRFALGEGGSTSCIAAVDNSIASFDTWYYVVCKIDGNAAEVRINTVQKGTDTFLGSRQSNDMPIRLGCDYTYGGDDYCNAVVIDELRVSATARSNAWIKANYNFQLDNMLSWGDKVQVPLFRHGFVNFQEPGVF